MLNNFDNRDILIYEGFDIILNCCNNLDLIEWIVFA